ncbi:phage tail assembly-like protein [Salmonella phage SPFM1]|nr:phage tail assembly-like protein [Salmonella phage SPFM1]
MFHPNPANFAERVDITNGQPVNVQYLNIKRSYNRNYLFFRTSRTLAIPEHPSYVDDNSKVVYSRPVEKTLLGVDTFIRKSFYHAVHEFGWLSRACDKTFADLMFLRIMEADLFYQKRSSVGFYPDTVEGNEALRPILHPDGPWAAAACVHDTPLWVTVPKGFVTDLASIPSLYREQTGMDAMVALAGVHPLLEKPWFILTDDFHFEFTLRSSRCSCVI